MKTNKRLKRLLTVLGWLNPFRWIAQGVRRLRNWRRSRYKKLDYITFTLKGEIAALPEQRNWWQQRVFGKPSLSLLSLERALNRLGDDPRPMGVVFYLRGLRLSFADLQTLRNIATRFREKGKRVIVFAQEYDINLYYLASTADEIVLQPGGELSVTGVSTQAIFLKDALSKLGIAFDSVAISPFKGAADQLTRSDISPEGAQQLNWLLDSRYDMVVQGIAAGRGINEEAVRDMIDGAPYVESEALKRGYVDAVLTDEGLREYLNAEHIAPYEEIRKKLLVKAPKRHPKHVAVLRVAGMMLPGESGSPPGDLPIPVPFAGAERAGDITVVQQVRALMKDESAAAVVLLVDSGGGAVTAAEAMTSALTELAKTRPLVVFMNGVAASGGYHIATAGQHIIAQPGTITGSIGVLRLKPVTGGVLDRLNVASVPFVRGANADIFDTENPFTDAQRVWVRESVEHIYAQFIERVAKARNMTTDAVDAVGGGRVWTGAQAVENGLVDELGDLQAALTKARKLADLPDDAPMHVVESSKKPLGPQLAGEVNPAASLGYLMGNARALCSGAALLITPVEIK